MSADNTLFDSKTITSLVFCRSANSISTDIENETIVLDIVNGLYSSLDAVGTTIWNQLANPSTFQQISKQILSTYDIDKEQCYDDLLYFLKELKKNDLIDVKKNEKTD